MENRIMRTLKIGYNSFVVPSNWTAEQLGVFAAQLAELTRIDDTGMEMPDGKWKTAYHHAPVDVAFSKMNEPVFENREQARDFLEAKARETAQLAAAA
jgi:hypothetical protein